MKKTFIMIIIAAVALLPSCRERNRAKERSAAAKTETAVPDSHTSQNSLDYEGIYEGTLPCADCAGIETTVTLDREGNYTRQMKYLGKENADKIVRESGKFIWSADGRIITLDGGAAPAKYQVGENVLFHLDMDGNRITGDSAALYILRKQPKE